MAKEVLGKIQAAEEENQKKRLAAKKTVSEWEAELQEELSELKGKQQEEIKNAIEKRKAELEEEVRIQQSSLFSNQKEADAHFQDLYEKNKGKALKVILQKVRENYGS